jgi:hypothetical protein
MNEWMDGWTDGRMCFTRVSREKASIPLNRINCLLFIIDTDRVLCEVQIEFMYTYIRTPSSHDRHITACHNIHALLHDLFHLSFILRRN